GQARARFPQAQAKAAAKGQRAAAARKAAAFPSRHNGRQADAEMYRGRCSYDTDYGVEAGCAIAKEPQFPMTNGLQSPGPLRRRIGHCGQRLCRCESLTLLPLQLTLMPWIGATASTLTPPCVTAGLAFAARGSWFRSFWTASPKAAPTPRFSRA